MAINHFVILETYGELCPFDPLPCLCSLVHRVARLHVTLLLMTSPIKTLSW
jgi:hypothetical protein